MERLNFLFQKGRINLNYYELQYQKLEHFLQCKHNDVLAASAQFPSNIQTKVQTEISGNWKILYENLEYEHRKCFWKQILHEIYIDRKTHKINGFRLL